MFITALSTESGWNNERPSLSLVEQISQDPHMVRKKVKQATTLTTSTHGLDNTLSHKCLTQHLTALM